MAQVAQKNRPSWLIDKDLQNLLGLWRTVEVQAAEWPEWNEFSRVDFIIEWPIEREASIRVKKAAKTGLLNERQQRDWQELQGLIETHRATMEWMLEGPI
jgi:hypothetical protein